MCLENILAYNSALILKFKLPLFIKYSFSITRLISEEIGIVQ